MGNSLRVKLFFSSEVIFESEVIFLKWSYFFREWSFFWEWSYFLRVKLFFSPILVFFFMTRDIDIIAVDSEQNSVIDSVVSCSVVELFITEATKIMILWCLTSCVHRSFASGQKCWSTSDSAWPCTWSTMHNRQVFSYLLESISTWYH